MHFLRRSRMSILFSLAAILMVVGGLSITGVIRSSQASAAPAALPHTHLDCSNAATAARCTDIANSDDIFGKYVGHDEPSNLFYSNAPGSGNQNSWKMTLPSDPSASNPLTPGKSYNFQLHPAFWFGMAMCDTQSDPNQIKTCTPDSDKNIVDPTVSPKHPGTAFTEMQFYPPGWQPFIPAFKFEPTGTSCDPTKWCAALNIDSLSDNPVTGQNNNPACAAAAGIEYVNFAFITKNGVPQGPPSPLLSNASTFVPNPNKVLFMRSGDTIITTMHDTSNGLRVDLKDVTTGQSGFMVASKANGFAQVKFDPTGTNCDPATHNLPYNFHPMYSTSSEKTNVPWAAHTYNIAFSDEIGHFDFCNGTISSSFPFSCTGTEGQGPTTAPTDGDDNFCFPASSSLLVKVSGCTDTNAGFNGQSYQTRWPDGNTKLHPTSILFSSPLTGSGYNVNYNRTAFETDLPLLEFELNGSCNIFSGVGCTLIPTTDTGTPANFYPFYSIRNVNGHCVWQLGNHIPGSSNDFHQNLQYGNLVQSSFTAFGGGGASLAAYFNFRQILSKNPCPA